MGHVTQRIRGVVAERFGLAINRTDNLYPWQVRPMLAGSHTAEVPEEAHAYLRLDNPRLLDLERRYADCDPAVVTPTVWNSTKISAEDLLYFRGDNPYVFQLRSRNGNELSYALTYYYLRAGAMRPILDAIDEDGAFGVHTWTFDGKRVSRDLLDSVAEIDFLQRHAGLGTTAMSILDIGAGYGRLAHRIAEVMPDVTVSATDAFPSSTFLSDYYLRFRRSRARVVPLDEIEDALAGRRIEIATNIHSFSECPPSAIDWWVSRLARHGVRQLIVVPNISAPDGRCLTNQGEDMDAIFARHGYICRLREGRYADPVAMRWGVDGSNVSLFDLT